jgi:hypothetical protein
MWYKTTTGQLCVLMWIIKEGIINYIEKNYEAIREDMIKTLDAVRQEKKMFEQLNITRTRKELSPPNQIKCIVYDRPQIMTINWGEN